MSQYGLIIYSKLNQKKRMVHFMFKRDGEEAIVGLVIGIAIICFIVYVIVLLATIIAGVAAASGTIFGGGSAIKNYTLSFKENVIDSNKQAPMAA